MRKKGNAITPKFQSFWVYTRVRSGQKERIKLSFKIKQLWLVLSGTQS